MQQLLSWKSRTSLENVRKLLRILYRTTTTIYVKLGTQKRFVSNLQSVFFSEISDRL
jgi:hypothetical protein